MTKYDFDFIDMFEAAQDVVIVTRLDPLDPMDSEILYVNKAFTDLTGYTANDAIGVSPAILQSECTNENTRKEIGQAFETEDALTTCLKKSQNSGGHQHVLELRIIAARNGKPKVTGYPTPESAVSDQQSLEIKPDTRSTKDELTGLLNRHAFDRMINQEFLRYLSTHNKFSVLLINIDNFNSINDSFGQTAADQALLHLAHLFDLQFRSSDHAARLADDEFCIALLDSSQIKALIGAERLRHLVEKNPLRFNDEQITMSVSIGVAEAQEKDLDFHEILERAQKALQTARKKGQNRVQKYIKEDCE